MGFRRPGRPNPDPPHLPMIRPSRAALAAFAMLALAVPAAAQDFARGQVIERVKAQGDTTQSYALYLPTGYDPARPSPVVFVMDPRGRAETAIRLFVPAAERHGYVLLSSYDTRSDIPTATNPTERALEAMLQDAQARLAVDERRIYLAGMSGTARAAWTFGIRLAGHVAGVIGFGAGLAGDGQVIQLRAMETPPFPFFGGAGDVDFNYEEMRALEPKLAALGIPHRLVYWPGEHGWPPEPVAREAMEWMQLRAMRDGRVPRDEAWTDSLLALRTAQARALEAADPAGALRRWRAVAEDFAGTRDVSAAAARAAQLERAPAVRRVLSEQARLSQRDSAHGRRFARFVREYGSGDGPVPHARAMAELEIEALRREAADTARAARSLSARRLLENVFIHAVFYGPRTWLERGDGPRALALLRLAGEVKPGSPQVCYATAAAHARLGQRDQARRELECAAASGLLVASTLEGDASFAALRADPAFRAILARLRSAAPQP